MGMMLLVDGGERETEHSNAASIRRRESGVGTIACSV